MAGELPGGGEQMLDALPGRDTPHVQDERRARRDAESRAEVAARRRLRGRGKAVSAHVDFLRRNAARYDGLALAPDATTTPAAPRATPR